MQLISWPSQTLDHAETFRKKFLFEEIANYQSHVALYIRSLGLGTAERPKTQLVEQKGDTATERGLLGCDVTSTIRVRGRHDGRLPASTAVVAAQRLSRFSRLEASSEANPTRVAQSVHHHAPD
jgi:hypothetical protein